MRSVSRFDYNVDRCRMLVGTEVGAGSRLCHSYCSVGSAGKLIRRKRGKSKTRRPGTQSEYEWHAWRWVDGAARRRCRKTFEGGLVDHATQQSRRPM